MPEHFAEGHLKSIFKSVQPLIIPSKQPRSSTIVNQNAYAEKQ
jgi:hypothetical protein